jgi:hypothetical protein
MNYFSVKDRYDPIVSNGAATKTSFLAGGKTKEVVNCHPSQAPVELHQLEEMIDTISQSELWIRDRSGNAELKP